MYNNSHQLRYYFLAVTYFARPHWQPFNAGIGDGSCDGIMVYTVHKPWQWRLRKKTDGSKCWMLHTLACKTRLKGCPQVKMGKMLLKSSPAGKKLFYWQIQNFSAENLGAKIEIFDQPCLLCRKFVGCQSENFSFLTDDAADGAAPRTQKNINGSLYR